LRVSGVVFLIFLVFFFTLSSVIHVGVNAAGTAFSDDAYARENAPTAQKIGGSMGSQRPESDTSVVELAQENSTETYQGGLQTLRVSASASSSPLINHTMCKDYTPDGAPVDLTTIFSPGDEKAVCLVTSPINGSVEFRWYYRSDTSKTWVLCYSCATTVTNMGCEGHLFIAGHELYCPRAYKVDAYLNGKFSFSDFFEITNGGLESPRTCEGVDTNGNPINIKSRFTIGADSNVYYYLRFDKIAYFNEELGCSHNFTTVWIQPDGSIYETYSGNFTDYKDVNVTWNCWEYDYATDDYMPINSSTPVGNWKVEVYLDSYFNGTWMPYGPVATTPFVVANKPVADWTFIVYLDADYNFSVEGQNGSAGIDTFLNIAEVGSSSQVNVVVQMDRIAGWWNNGVWTSDGRFDNWTDCKRFYVTTNMTPTAGNAISDLGEVDMGDPATLRDFVNWTIHSYPANHYCLVLWDHGAGFVGLCIDSTNNDFLSMSKLSQALDGLPVIIDVVFNDACSMSMTEVAYQAKDYADIMVGYEGLGYSPSPYNWYLAHLTSNPSMMPSELATQVVSDYIAWCNHERQIYSQQGHPQVIQNATMSAIDLTRITSLSAAIDDFAMDLKDKETPYDQQICWARNQTEEYPGPYEGDTGCYVDLYDFAQRINASTGQNAVDEELRNTAGQVMTAINESMIVAENILLPNSHGLAIFFPSDGARYSSFENEYENTAFAADTAWNEFLQYHLSGCLLTIQTIPPYPNIPVTVANESYIPVTAVSAGALNYSYVTDDDGKAQAFLPPAYYTVNVTAYVSTGLSSRSAFIQWEDNRTSNSRTLFVNGTTMLTAVYQPQYQLIINANLGTTIPSVGAYWCNAGSAFSVSTTAPPLAFSPTQEQYVLLGWNGTGNGSYSGMADSSLITMNGPINETVNWRHEYYLTVDSIYGLPTLSSGWMEAGTSILASVTPPAPTDTQYVCTGWNGTGSVPASGTETSANLSITQPSSLMWNWKTQYRVNVNTDPAGLIPQPSFSPGPWYDDGTVLTCTAQNVSGKAFDRWTLDDSSYEPGRNSINITVYGPHTAVAHYLPAAAWWNNLFVPANMPFVLALFAVLAGSLVGGVWVRTSRNRIKKTYPQPAPVTIPKVALANRISTGCEALDSLLYGGIPKGYSVALTAPSCDERDSLIKGFLEAGAKSGDATFHVTIDPAELASLAREYQSNFYLFVCSPQADTMIESLPNVFKLKGVENLTEISIALAKAFRAPDALQNVPRRACVEIISDVLLQHHALQTRRWLTGLIPEFRSKGFTTLAVINLQMHPQEEVQAILDLFEGQIAIFEKDTGTGPLKFVRVKKMTNQKYSDCELPLNKESLETHDKQKDSAR